MNEQQIYDACNVHPGYRVKDAPDKLRDIRKGLARTEKDEQ